jgi:hypothetical protein
MTVDQIKKQIEFWFSKYHHKQLDDFDGNETFTLFDKFDSIRKQTLISKLNLNDYEIPVLILVINDNEYIINTTHRFIQIKDSKAISLNYKDFDYHAGYKSILAGREASGKPIGIKTDGYFADFGLRLKDESLIYWQIPTGFPGFAFWNVTKKCELIGRKYL